MQPDYEVVVAGGGPAGARCAGLLAARGHSVLLLEAEGSDVDVLCSGLLNREAQQALGCELPEEVRCEPQKPLLEFHDADNRLRYRYDPDYLNMHRPQFDAWLRELAAEAGAEIRYNCRAQAVGSSYEAAVVRTAEGEITSRFVIDATGWRALSRRTGPAGKAPQLHAFQGLVAADLPDDAMWAVYITAETPFYGWVVPKGGGRFLLGAGFRIGHKSTRDQAHDPWSKLEPFSAYLRSCGFSIEPPGAKPRGSPITCISSLGDLWPGRDRIFTVGEAAGMVSPSSGDGISYSLQSAAAVARVLSAEIDRPATEFLPMDSVWRADVNAKIRSAMAPALRELNFNCFKARLAASPGWRGVAARLLPLYLRRRVDRLPFVGTK